MGVHKKLMDARILLQQAPLKKSGHNKFAGYSYFELGDFLPTINQIFAKVGLCGVVSFDKELATLTITDTEDSTEIKLTSPMADSSAPLKEDKVIISPTQGAQDNIPPEELQYLQEMAVELIATCEQGDPKAAWDKLEAENLDSEQKIALWTLLPSKVRSALKKAKEM